MTRPLGSVGWRTVAWVLVISVGIAGCGGDDDGEASPSTTERRSEETTTVAPTTTPPDPYASATAAGLLLTPEELGPEWATGAPGTPTLCDGAPLVEDPSTFGGPLDTAEASLENAELGAVQAVALHRDPAAAQAVLDAWTARMTTCARTGTQDGIEYTIQTTPAAIGPYGEQSWASLLTIDAAGQAFAGYEVLYRKGRALVYFSVVGWPESLSDQRADELMAAVQTKASLG